MIVDSSALVAAVLDEDHGVDLLALMRSRPARMSVANHLEAAIVLDSRADPAVGRRLDDLVAQAQIELVPVSVEQAAIARAAHRDYGRGSGHPARLNFGDCFAYALARDTGEPLVFVGDDFTHTDVIPAT